MISKALEYISEDDLKTFEGWANYQAFDPAALTPDELASVRELYDDVVTSRDDEEDGSDEAEGCAWGISLPRSVREGEDLWIALWIRRNWKGEFFVVLPRADVRGTRTLVFTKTVSSIRTT